MGIANFYQFVHILPFLFFSTVQNGKQKCKPMMEKWGENKSRGDVFTIMTNEKLGVFAAYLAFCHCFLSLCVDAANRTALGSLFLGYLWGFRGFEYCGNYVMGSIWWKQGILEMCTSLHPPMPDQSMSYVSHMKASNLFAIFG